MSARRRVAAALLAIVATLGSLVPARADAQHHPKRPKLDAAADTNDWQAYWLHGTSIVRRSPAFAEPYFEWAQRLHPGRAEPLFARWVAYWMRDPGGYLRRLEGDERFVASAAVRAVDSLKLRALLRNPFVDRSLEVILIDRLPGVWLHDPSSVAWIRYANRDFAGASQTLAAALQRHPERRRALGFQRALTLVAAGHADSAGRELAALLEALRAADADSTVRTYESKAVLEYGLGLLLATAGDTGAARLAFERALVEDLAFAPAREGLGRLALLARDTAAAAREFEAAVELNPADGYLRYHQGSALYSARRYEEALAAFRATVALEPWFADGYFGVASVLEALGDTAGALAWYRDFLARAPRRATPMREAALGRLAALAAAAPR